MTSTVSGATVSVVIPAYNAERHLTRALDSIARQTLRPTEIIVVDNLSTDRTAQQAAGWNGPIPVNVTCCETPGSAAARNKGINVARGELISFLDADDIWHPQKMEMQLRMYKEGADFLCGTFMRYVTPRGRVLGDNARYSDLSQPSIDLSNAETVPAPLSSITVASRTLKQSGMFDETFRRAQDFEWMLRAVKVTPLRIPTNTPLVDYIMEPDSSTANGYIEQGLAAIEIKEAHRQNRAPVYHTGVLNRLANNDVPKSLHAGLAYRRAGILYGQGHYFATARHLTRAALLDPKTTIDKLKWQVVRRKTVQISTNG